MKLTHKDKSLLLFIAAILVVLWGIFTFFSHLFVSAAFRSANISKLVGEENRQWFNISRPLTTADLKGRIILLDFWTYDCVNCIQALAEIKKMEKQFGSKITIIGIHSGKFENQKDSSAIKKAILRHDLTHPVINDSDLKIWNNFKVKTWPTFILLNPRGNVVKKYFGEGELPKVKSDIKKLISKYKFQINRDPLPEMLEKFDVIGNVLNFPTKLLFVSDFSHKSRLSPAIIIANSGQNNILVSSLTGKIIAKIGSGKEGFEDGNLETASFSSPQGLLYDAGKLYVADKGNHSLRVVDFKDGTVSSLIGSGQLSSPTDIEFFPDKNSIAIANSGTNQILSYSLKNQAISILAGNGSEGIEDGKYPQNSLSQTADMSVFNHKLYFVDSQSSSLRLLDESGNVKTLIGKDLAKFGHENGDKNRALMQHPLGLLVDDTGAYIADSFNHTIRKYDFSSGQIRDFIGTKKRGEKLGGAANTQLDEPEGIISVLNHFYISDSNNNRILAVSRASLNSELFEVMPPLKLPKEGFLQYLPNLQKAENAEVKSDSEIAVKIDLQKGWKINESGPSFLNLLELVKNDQANLVANFDWHAVQTHELKLPKLKTDNDYLLQGVIYYCEDKKNALCYVKSYEQKITAASAAEIAQIIVKLGY